MSGIAGIIHFDGKPIEPGLIEKMTGAMAHRGPDGISHWVKGSVALGQCMLRTTPESLEEHQPLTNEDESLVLVMDGRVDNWEELRRELLGRGAVLRNRSDAELVLRAYEIWAEDCLAHIDGDFALVIWSARRREAFCARDRMGNKPFNYHWDGRTFVFCSELHAISALPWVPEILSEGMVAEFLANEWYSRSETFWKGILRLVAAHFMVVTAAKIQPISYWAPDLGATLPCSNDEEYIGYYRELFTQVVRRMSRSCAPIACEVSGGLDSSAVFSIAEHLRRGNRLLAPGLQGYTLGFTGDSDANELGYAREMGGYLGVDIKEIAPSKMPLSWYRQWARRYREFPSYPNGVMGLGIMTEAKQQRSRALLTGVGGDEWLGGSRRYYADALAAKGWKTVFSYFESDRREVGLLRSAWWVVRHGVYLLLPDGVRKQLRNIMIRIRARGKGSDPRDILTPAMLRVLQQRCNQFAQSCPEQTNLIGKQSKMLTLSSAYAAHARELMERMAGSVGVELRQPLCDPRLVEFSFSTPEWLRLRGRTNKYLHRRAMRGLLPERILKRETKADFMVTFHWHLAEMGDFFCRDVFQSGRAWVNPGRVSGLFKEIGHTEDGTPEWQLWTLFGCDALR